MENLTATEIEFIKLKRIEDQAKEDQAKLQEQLQYEKDLKYYEDHFQKDVLKIKNANINCEKAYNKLIDLGCKDHIELISKNVITSYPCYVKEKFGGDFKSIEIECYEIKTKWDNLRNFTSDIKCELPYKLSSRYQSYNINTIAKKILEKVELEIQDNIIKNKKLNYQSNFIEEQTKLSPEGTTFEVGSKWFGSFGRNNGGGELKPTIKISYPNGSWVLCVMYSGSWYIHEKFDSKYIKPETNEAWLEYLMK